jgi:hypothetical protein
MYESVEKSSEKFQVATLLDPETYAEFARIAEQNERSVAAELRLAIKLHLARPTVEAAA